MLSNEERAHDIAIAALPALIRNHQERRNLANPATRMAIPGELDVYNTYKDIYESCLRTLSENTAE